jgi:microcystin-dependent protein
MSYRIFRTDQLNGSITVDDNTIDDSTSLRFPGRNTTGYGQIIGENFLHLLENFASKDEPQNPVQGQLWYDTNVGINQLKVYDGTGWGAAGGLKKGSSTPDSESSIAGDLWVNTNTQQLFLFTGSGWILVGPTVSSGAKTGAEPEFIDDIAGTGQLVVSQYVGGERVMIISKSNFVPKSVIIGFPQIRSGVNLNTSYQNYFGIAENAAALLVGTTSVPAANFLRSDITSSTNFGIEIRTPAGLSVGSDRQLTLGLEGTVGVLLNKTTGSSLDLRINNNGTIRTMARIDSNERIGFGVNNFSPQETVDVSGTFAASGISKFNATTESINTSTGSVVIAGGVGIAKDVNIAGNLTIRNESDLIVAGGDIVPEFDGGASIGTISKRFNNVYATRVFGSFSGELTGSVTGNISGSAAKLASSTVFELTGDIVSSQVEFDGQKSIPTLTTLSASGDGTTVTLTFQTQTVAPYPVGSTITVSNIVPIGYRGTYIVTGATPDSVSFASLVTGAQTTAGSIQSLEPVGNRKRFFTKLSDSFITEKEPTTLIEDTDEFIVSREVLGLRKITKKSLFSAIPTMPIGSLIPYAGPVAPQGWLLCDGSEVQTSDYPLLFDIIKYTYGDQATLLGLGTFRLPDLRGRFPLGLDNMNSGNRVPQGPGSGEGWDSSVNIETIGASANRVTDPRADINQQDPFTARSGGGEESIVLQQSNLPDHEHDLRGNAGNPYYAYRNSPGSPSDTDAVSGTGNPPEDSGLGQYLGTSGGILTNPPGTFNQTALNIMNPFMALNFIIYTGA